MNRIEDRLDEKTARRIASGRLDAARRDAEEKMKSVAQQTKRSKNSKVRVDQFVNIFQKSYGHLLLLKAVQGRTIFLFLAQPLGGGAVVIDMLKRNTRSGYFNWNSLLYVTPHATARLMERRRSAKVEELIGEEFTEAAIHNLMMCADKFPIAKELQMQTANGHFVIKQDEERIALFAAKTWIPKGV